MLYNNFDCSNDIFANGKIKEDINLIFNWPHHDVVQIEINGRKYQNNLIYLESDILIRIATKLWKQIEDIVLSEKSTSTSHLIEIRKELVRILLGCRDCLLVNNACNNYSHMKNCFSKPLVLLRKTVFPLFKLNDDCMRKVVYDKNENSPNYIYLHTYLDIQWLLLCLLHLSDIPKEEVEKQVRNVIKDLVKISFTIFKTDNQNSLDYYSFSCMCVKGMWLKLQIFVGKIYNGTFWELLDLPLEDSETLTVWLLLNIACLQGTDEDMEIIGPDCHRINPNFSILEKTLKSFLAKSFNYDEMLILLKYLDKLLNYWWKKYSKIDLYQILWDHFNKSINISFTRNENIPQQVEQFVSLIDQLSSGQDYHLSTSCYDFFLNMLAKHLSQNPNHWPRIKGRIYSRLPLHKMNEFNEIGLYHIITLFLSLHRSVDLDEIASKLLILLENLSEDRQNSHLVWNTYMTLIVIHDRKRISIEKAAEPLIQLVEAAVDNRNHFYLVKLYVDGLNFIFKTSPGFSHGRSILLSSWICKYMIHCQHSELNNLINILCETVRKIHETDEWSEWENVFKVNVLPGLKQIAYTLEAPTQVGELVALICQRSRDISNDCLQQFTEEAIAPKITTQFLNFYLNECSDIQILPKNQEILIVQAWTRCSLLMLHFNENLTKKVFKLSTISSYINKEAECCDSLYAFIKNLGNQISSHSNNNRLREICEICFGHADRWIERYLAKPSAGDLVLHLYTTFGILFYHCSAILYHKAKSNCLLSRLVSTLLLPTDFLKGKVPHNFILSAIQRTWHLYMQGLFHLGYENDPYMERLMKDLVIRYLPHLPTATSPMLKCLENEKLCIFIFDKMCSAFLSSSKSSEDNTSKALKLIMVAIQNSSSNKQVELLIQKILPCILEAIIFHAHKAGALELFKSLICSEHYVSIKDIIRHSIVAVVDKHLAFNVNSTFQLLAALSKLVPMDIQAVLPNIKKQVSVVEKMRGVGFDNTLRRNLDNIEKLLNN